MGSWGRAATETGGEDEPAGREDGDRAESGLVRGAQAPACPVGHLCGQGRSLLPPPTFTQSLRPYRPSSLPSDHHHLPRRHSCSARLPPRPPRPLPPPPPHPHVDQGCGMPSPLPPRPPSAHPAVHSQVTREQLLKSLQVRDSPPPCPLPSLTGFPHRYSAPLAPHFPRSSHPPHPRLASRPPPTVSSVVPTRTQSVLRVSGPARHPSLPPPLPAHTHLPHAPPSSLPPSTSPQKMASLEKSLRPITDLHPSHSQQTSLLVVRAVVSPHRPSQRSSSRSASPTPACSSTRPTRVWLPHIPRLQRTTSLSGSLLTLIHPMPPTVSLWPA